MVGWCCWVRLPLGRQLSQERVQLPSCLQRLLSSCNAQTRSSSSDEQKPTDERSFVDVETLFATGRLSVIDLCGVSYRTGRSIRFIRVWYGRFSLFIYSLLSSLGSLRLHPCHPTHSASHHSPPSSPFSHVHLRAKIAAMGESLPHLAPTGNGSGPSGSGSKYEQQQQWGEMAGFTDAQVAEFREQDRWLPVRTELARREDKG